jgi:signal transduction histidine kinase
MLQFFGSERPRSATYAGLGAMFGMGAPLGYFVLRGMLGEARFSRHGVAREAARERLTYGYLMTGTVAAFSLFGLVLGRRDDVIAQRRRERDRLREELSAIVVGDLQSPLQALLLQSDHLHAHGETGKVTVPVSALHRLEESAERLADLVEDLREASMLELDLAPIRPASVELPPLVRAASDRVRSRLATRPVEVRTHGDVPIVRADPTRVQQIVAKLLEAAARLSPGQTGLVVDVKAERNGASISIRAPEQPWDRARANALTSGMVVARRLAEALGGEMIVDDARDLSGTSRMTVWLPAASGSPQHPEP